MDNFCALTVRNGVATSATLTPNPDMIRNGLRC